MDVPARSVAQARSAAGRRGGESAAVPPLPGWSRPRQPVRLIGNVDDQAQAFQSPTTYDGPRYFATLSGGVVEGREFDDRDTPDGPRVALVNETLARRLFPTGGAAGSTVIVGDNPIEIVGVVQDLQFLSVMDRPEPIVYLNFWQQNRADNRAED